MARINILSLATKLEEKYRLDSRSLAVFRIGLASALLLDLFCRLQYFSANYTENGFVPQGIVPSTEGFSLYMLSDATGWAGFLFLTGVLAGFSLLLGFHTRASAILSFILYVSLCNRNPYISFAFDQLMSASLLFAALLPTANIWSLDARLFKKHVKLNIFYALVFRLQVAIVYGFTILMKTAPDWRSSFTAVEILTYNDQFFRSWMGWLQAYPVMMKMMTFLVVVAWFLTPVLLFSPRRWHQSAVSWLVIIVHLGSALVIRMDYFPLLAIAVMAAFLDWPKKTGPVVSMPFAVPTKRSVICAVAIALLILAGNITTTANQNRLPWPAVETMARSVGFRQHWGMFAPTAFRQDGWPVFLAQTEDGRQFDLFRGGQALSWQKPINIFQLYATQRMRKFITKLRHNRQLQQSSLGYLCRNAEQKFRKKIAKVAIYYFNEYKTWKHAASIQKEFIGERRCQPSR